MVALAVDVTPRSYSTRAVVSTSNPNPREEDGPRCESLSPPVEAGELLAEAVEMLVGAEREGDAGAFDAARSVVPDRLGETERVDAVLPTDVDIGTLLLEEDGSVLTLDRERPRRETDRHPEIGRLDDERPVGLRDVGIDIGSDGRLVEVVERLGRAGLGVRRELEPKRRRVVEGERDGTVAHDGVVGSLGSLAILERGPDELVVSPTVKYHTARTCLVAVDTHDRASTHTIT